MPKKNHFSQHCGTWVRLGGRGSQPAPDLFPRDWLPSAAERGLPKHCAPALGLTIASPGCFVPPEPLTSNRRSSVSLGIPGDGRDGRLGPLVRRIGSPRGPRYGQVRTGSHKAPCLEDAQPAILLRWWMGLFEQQAVWQASVSRQTDTSGVWPMFRSLCPFRAHFFHTSNHSCAIVCCLSA